MTPTEMVAFGRMRRRRPHRGTRSQPPVDVPVYGRIGKGPGWDTEEAEGAGVRNRGLASFITRPSTMRPEKTERAAYVHVVGFFPWPTDWPTDFGGTRPIPAWYVNYTS